MASSVTVVDIPKALQDRLYATVTVWNRLEGRPRTSNFDRALRAEVRDALWMLTKQFQMGEFRGSDAGSPVFAKLNVDITRLTKYAPDAQPAEAFENGSPLEAKVERRRIPLTLDLRLLMGRQWLALILTPPGIPDYRSAFIKAYGIKPPDPKVDAQLCAHPEVWQAFAAAAGRAMDGGKLYEYLTQNANNHAYDNVQGMSPNDYATLDDCAKRFLAWFQRLFFQPSPSSDDAWIPERLEYQFSASAPLSSGGEKVYASDEYYQGRLDWYNLNVNSGSAGLGNVAGAGDTGFPPTSPKTVIPTPLSFAGMPNTRWWSFEDHKTNFGDINPSTTDLAKLVFMEFALVYANDWFVIPYTLPASAIATISGFVVTNVFGERFLIQPAGAGPNSNWQKWGIFTISTQGQAGAAADTSLVLLPTVAKVQESAPTEEVLLIRDEVANMVWGLEKTIPVATGESKPGLESARQLLTFLRNQLAPQPAPPASAANIRYQLMTTVPENWIPFIPVRVDGSYREIQIQRAAMPRILNGGPNPPDKVRPRTVLLRQGLDEVPPQPYFIYEEEVPRAGTRLFQSFQRTRWRDGTVFNWLRVRRQTGRGEGASGLAFDQIVNVPPASTPGNPSLATQHAALVK